jgi:thymidylate kinase
VILVSFSGIDGAGKSTQIDNLRNRLTTHGATVRVLTFWDNVAVFRQFREDASLVFFKGDPGVGTPERPANRRDKNVSSWYLLPVRLVFAVLDAMHLIWVVKRSENSRFDVIIFDRYLYDSLANLPLERPFVRRFVRLLLNFVPCPDVACLLDADPEAARRRKPEYPLDFLFKNRQRYLALAAMAKEITVIGPLDVAEVEKRVLAATSGQLPGAAMADFSSAVS